MKKLVCTPLVLIACFLFASTSMAQIGDPLDQGLTSEAYQELKESGQLPPPEQITPPTELTDQQTIEPEAIERTEGFIVPLDESFSVLQPTKSLSISAVPPGFNPVPFQFGSPPDYRNDDGSTPPIPLPFPFSFFGTQYNEIYINNNGNVSLDVPVRSYSSTGFPASGFGMVAPFWADVDTRNPSGGVVYFKSEAHRFTVIWDGVGFYSNRTDKLNTFELVITDGTDPLIGIGNNVCFDYGDMQWTTGNASGGVDGLGGIPATVGANKGDGVNFAIVGRFDHEGTDYDGAGGNADGVSYLDGRTFCFNVAQGAGTIAGTKFRDENGNGIREPWEAGLPGWTISLNPGSRFVTTDSDGNYFFSFLDPNIYTVAEVLKPHWEQTYPLPPGTHTVTLSDGQTVTGVDFGNRPLADIRDLRVSVAGGIARPGFQKFYGVTYENTGTVNVDGTVKFNLPPLLGYLASSPGGVYDSGAHSVTWSVGVIPAGVSGWLWVNTQIPATVPLGTALTSSATIRPVAGDASPPNNSDSETQIVRGSFDPNDKNVSPDGYIDPGELLTYTVRFQNVGTDTAFNIIVRDVLDDNLDLTTLQLGASSHPYTFGIVDPREMVWTFGDIRLPDSTNSEPASHGFLKFTVQALDNVAIGTVIENDAAIYFDFNAPVITNTVQSEVGGPTNLPPTADAGPDATIECVSPDGESVALDGSASSDPDGDPLTYTWSGPFSEGNGTVTGATPSVTLPLGSHTIVLTVSDGNGGSDTDEVVVTIEDTAPPEITLGPTRVLWPPNHKYTTVRVEDFVTSVEDLCAGAIDISSVVITTASSDEPENGSGDGNTVDDIVIDSYGESVKLRVERSGNGNGRVYTLNVAVSDPEGNEATASYQVQVPHSKKGAPAVDDGPVYTVDSGVGPKVLATVPTEYGLSQNVPNPFNPATEIRFALPEVMTVRLAVYNLLGQEIRVLVDRVMNPGTHRVIWNGQDHLGRQVSSGVYLYQLNAGDYSEIKRMTLVK